MRIRNWVMLSWLILASVSGAEVPGRNVLIVGGGTSHDFNTWWKQADAKTLTQSKDPAFVVNYTDQPNDAARLLVDADALLLATNQVGFSIPEVRKAMAARVLAGRGMVILHAGAWYNYKDWPEYNRTYVGGGARSHDKPAEFEVTVIQPDHPLMKGVALKFKITDELYHMVPDPAGAPIEVLATAKSPISGKTFPSIWVVKNEKARIAVIALGHDGRAHDLEPYQTLLINATTWVSSR